MDKFGIVMAALAAAGFNIWTVPLFGVPLTVMAIAVLGAVLGASYGEPIRSRKDLLKTVTGHAFLATVMVAVIPAALGWAWVIPKLEAPLAGLLAFSFKFAIPAIPWTEVIRKLFKLESKRGERDYYEDYRHDRR